MPWSAWAMRIGCFLASHLQGFGTIMYRSFKVLYSHLLWGFLPREGLALELTLGGRATAFMPSTSRLS